MNNQLIKYYVTAQVNMYSAIKKYAEFRKDQRGVTAIEYALIGVAMATMLALVLGSSTDKESLIGRLKFSFDEITKAIKGVTTATKSASTGS